MIVLCYLHFLSLGILKTIIFLSREFFIPGNFINATHFMITFGVSLYVNLNKTLVMIVLLRISKTTLKRCHVIYTA